MINKEALEKVFEKHGITDYKWVCPATDVFVEQWVRFRCYYGCNGFGKSGTCPPTVPSVAECREAVMCYQHGILIHDVVTYEDAESYSAKLVDITKRHMAAEKDVFLEGCYKALLFTCDGCHTCKECTADGCREKCVNGLHARPGMDAMSIDVYKTARKAGYDVNVLKNNTQPTDRFALLLID